MPFLRFRVVLTDSSNVRIPSELFIQLLPRHILLNSPNFFRGGRLGLLALLFGLLLHLAPPENKVPVNDIEVDDFSFNRGVRGELGRLLILLIVLPVRRPLFLPTLLSFFPLPPGRKRRQHSSNVREGVVIFILVIINEFRPCSFCLCLLGLLGSDGNFLRLAVLVLLWEFILGLLGLLGLPLLRFDLLCDNSGLGSGLDGSLCSTPLLDGTVVNIIKDRFHSDTLFGPQLCHIYGP
mmetsp:Transcript_9600/g.19531  ORF Transcript_9600/g.19531 Transcript_9600/m.19531 type:complete len:237 (-) Transcript_9600:595-1305(-)